MMLLKDKMNNYLLLTPNEFQTPYFNKIKNMLRVR